MSFFSPSIYFFLSLCFIFINPNGNWSYQSKPMPIEGVAALQLARTTPLGTIDGAFSVNGNGAATYEIEINVPPGINGVQPNLTLQYNSQAGNGLLGVGWTLNGISTIQRIGKTQERDDINTSVSLTSNDRFAIDGQALIAYRDSNGKLLTKPTDIAAAYGQDGTEYRTEIDSWSRIISKGNCGNGPCRFIVLAKDGSQSEYGSTEDARMEASGKSNGVVREWAINKVTDRHGNEVNVNYNEDPQHEWYYPAAIYYTSNNVKSSPAQRVIAFDFENRNDKIAVFVAGSKVTTAHRLRAIRTYVDLDGDGQNITIAANLVKQYQIGYRYSQSTAQSIIATISECDAAGQCLPATQLEYDREKPLATPFDAVLMSYRNATISQTGSPLPNDGPGGVLVTGDYNGDGSTDFIRQEMTSIPSYYTPPFQVWLSNRNGTFSIISPVSQGAFYATDGSFIPGDYNGDAKTDFIWQAKDAYGSSLDLYLSNGDGTFRSSSFNVNQPSNYNQYHITPSDYNGDGNTDFIGQPKDQDGNVYPVGSVFIANGDGTFQARAYNFNTTTVNTGVQILEKANIIPGDYNGDGNTDFLYQKGNNNQPASLQLHLSTGDGSFQFTPLQQIGGSDNKINIPAEAELLTGDYNGDRYTDFLCRENGSFRVYFSTGNGTFLMVSPKQGTAGNDIYQDKLRLNNDVKIILGDYNGDGKTDLMRSEKSPFIDPAITYQIYTSNGDGTFQLTSLENKLKNNIDNSFQVIADQTMFVPGDYNGDGTSDLIIQQRTERGIFDPIESMPISSQPGNPSNTPQRTGGNYLQLHTSPISASNVITRITNGMGEVMEISHKTITDPSVYEKGVSEVPHVIAAQIPLWIVAQHQQKDDAINPKRIFTYNHQYKYARIDKKRGWLGFKETYLIDPQNQTTTVTLHNLDFPLHGTISQRVLLDINNPGIILGIITTQYGSYQVPNTKIYRVFQEKYIMDHYSEGTRNYTLQKIFHYDNERKNIIFIENLGDAKQNGDNLYTCFEYGPQAETASDWWKAFYPKTKKVSTSQSCNLVVWNANTDVEWEKYTYGPKMDLIAEEAFQDTDGGEGADNITNTWISDQYAYDDWGNVIHHWQVLNPGTITETYYQYDNTFHTFLITQLNPVNKYGVPTLKSSFFYDPRFGSTVKELDVNGNTTYNVPDGGMDGLGRVLKIQGCKPDSKDLVTLSERQFSQEIAVKNYEKGISIKNYYRKNWEDANIYNGMWDKEFLDVFGRAYRTESSGYDPNSTLVERVEYNARGNIEKEYVPYYYHRIGGVHYSAADAKKFPDPHAPGTNPLYEANENAPYQLYEYDRHNRPFKDYSPNPNSNNQLQLVREIDYNLHNDREVVYKMPHPDIEGKFVFWIQNVDTYGRTITKKGPLNENLGTLPETGTTSYKYDPSGNVIQTIDPAGEISTFTYNSLGYLIAETKPETGKRTYRYNPAGWLISQKDAKGQEIRYIYDGLGRVLSKYTLDANKQQKKAITYQYDITGVPNGLGNLGKVLMPEGVFEYYYDNTGQLKEERVSITGLDINNDNTNEQFITRYIYDAQGVLEQITYPDKSLVRFQYNNFDGNLSQIQEKTSNAFAAIANFGAYHISGNAGTIDYANGVNTAFSYDILGRLQSNRTSKGAFEHNFFKYNWNIADKLKTIQDIRKSRDKDLTQSFNYDPVGRLNGVSGNAGIESFSYDASGNRMNNQVPDGDLSYMYDPQNKHQLRVITEKRSKFTISEYTYDKNGNIILQYNKAPFPNIDYSENTPFSPGGLQYEYDEENRIIGIKRFTNPANANTLHSFTYDSAGNRLTKKEADNTTTYYISPFYEVVRSPQGQFIHTRYVQGEEGIVQSKSKNGAEVSLLAANDALGTLLEKGGSDFNPFVLNYWFLKYLFFGGFLLFIFSCIQALWKALQKHQHKLPHWAHYNGYRPLVYAFLIWSFSTVHIIPANAQQAFHEGYPEAGQVRYFHSDHLGSPILLTDNTGGAANQIAYEPFGRINEQNTTGKDNFRPKFTGKELDQKTGLHYFGSRYYDANVGRFISPDPALQYHSPYVYGNDDPLSGVDPDGEFFVLLAFIVVGLIIGAYAGGAIANHDPNPVHWDWSSGKTWAGIVTGGLVGVAAGAFAGAGLAAMGVAGAGSIAGIGATTIGGTALDLAFLAYDGYQFSQEQSAENAIYLALDLIPFAGPLIGKGIKAFRNLARGADAFLHGAEAVEHEINITSHEGEFLEHGACPLSFAKDTEVLTAEGIQPIQSIAVGDQVWAFNESTGQKDLYPVSRIFKRLAPALLMIALANDTIAVTPEHPFYLKDKGWVEAGDLQKGDALLRADKSIAPILSIAVSEQAVEVYNFEVEDAHSYYVSEEGILVHNPSCSQDAKTLRKNMKRRGKREPAYENRAHHIVESHDPAMHTARNHLQNLGLDINHGRNGIFLPKGSAEFNAQRALKPKFKTPPHSKIHTKAYKQYVTGKITKTTTRREAKDTLKKIRIKIQKGELNHLLNNFNPS